MGFQPVILRYNSLMKNMRAHAWVYACVCVGEVCEYLNILVFSWLHTLARLVMASRSRAASVGAKAVKVPLNVVGTTAGIQTSVTFV